MMIKIRKAYPLILAIVFFAAGLYCNFYKGDIYIDVKITAGLYVLAVIMVALTFVIYYYENEQKRKEMEDRINQLENKP